MAATESELAGARATLAALDAAINSSDEGLAHAARARGGTLVGEGLEVDPKLRPAVAAALGAAATAFLVDEASVEPLAGRRGTLAVRGSRTKPAPASSSSSVVQAAVAAGGGALVDAILRDPQGDVTRLIGRVIWLPTIAAALDSTHQLPAGMASGYHGGRSRRRPRRRDAEQRRIGARSARRKRKSPSAMRKSSSDALAAERAEYERRLQEAAATSEASQAAITAVSAARQEARRADEIGARRTASRRATAARA